MGRSARKGPYAAIYATSALVRQVFEIARQDGMTLEWLAEVTGKRRPTLSCWRSGANMPPVDQLEKMLDAMGYRLVVVRKKA